MSSKKVVIHMGLQKTASTLLQRHYFNQLNDITYVGRPYTQENKAFNLLQYADNSLFEHQKFMVEAERILNNDAQSNTVLISDELFNGYAFYNFLNRGTIAERLSRAFPNAEVILFLRNQHDLILSLYNQYVKLGWYNGILNEQFIHAPKPGYKLKNWFEQENKQISPGRFINHRSLFNINHLKYSTMIAFYEQLFSKVHVFLYEDFILNADDNLKRIDHILEIESSTEHLRKTLLQKQTNPSLKHSELEKQRLKNIISPVFKPNHWSSKIISKVMRINAVETAQKNTDYTRKLIREAQIFQDNKNANKTWNLGMEKYAKDYLGAI